MTSSSYSLPLLPASLLHLSHRIPLLFLLLLFIPPHCAALYSFISTPFVFCLLSFFLLFLLPLISQSCVFSCLLPFFFPIFFFSPVTPFCPFLLSPAFALACLSKEINKQNKQIEKERNRERKLQLVWTVQSSLLCIQTCITHCFQYVRISRLDYQSDKEGNRPGVPDSQGAPNVVCVASLF